MKSPRAGPGRPPGALTTLSRSKAEMLLRSSNLTPLDVMIANMRFHHENGAKFAAEITKHLADRNSTPDQILQAMNKFYNAINLSQSCAVDAAPYFHAKLSSIQVKTAASPTELNNDDLIRVIAATIPEERIREALGDDWETGMGEAVPSGASREAAD